MKTLLAPAFALGAAIAWLAALTYRPLEFSLTATSFDRLQATSLAFAVGLASGVAAWGAARRGLGHLVVISIGGVGVTAVVGIARLADLSRATEVLTASLWLCSAAAVFAATIVSSNSFAWLARPAGWSVTVALAATGVLAAVLGAGRALTASTGLSGAGTVALGAHVAVLLGAIVWVTVATWREVRRAGGRRMLLRDPVVLTALAWFVVGTVERIVHLLPLASYRNLYRDAYRPWALLCGVYLPLFAAGAVVVALAWSLGMRPRVERLASGVLVAPDRDPIAMLRDDLAAWAGDPTLELAYAGGEGRWIYPLGERRFDDALYHRATTVVTHDGQPIGLINHDLSLAHAPDALQTAAELAGVAFHANQLLALSEARLAETHQLGERLFVADATTRDDVLAELEGGPIGRLESCADLVRFGAPISEVVERLREATAEVRVLSHGLYPPELIEGGLRAVLGDRVGTPDRRLPPAIEITAFLLADDDPTTWFEDDGSVLRVHRAGPVTQRSVADRVEVLGGSFVGSSVCLPVEAQ